MYLVSECTTKSAPSANGWVAMGVAKVESTANATPWASAMAATAAMSVRRRVGFAGVSIQSMRVSGRIAASTAARSLVSTGVVSIP